MANDSQMQFTSAEEAMEWLKAKLLEAGVELYVTKDERKLHSLEQVMGVLCDADDKAIDMVGRERVLALEGVGLLVHDWSLDQDRNGLLMSRKLCIRMLWDLQGSYPLLEEFKEHCMLLMHEGLGDKKRDRFAHPRA